MITKAKCPNCGKIIDVEDADFLVYCKFCGVPFMPSEGIDKYKKYVEGNVMVEDINYTSDDISNYIDLGYSSLKEKNHEKCGFYAEDILRRSPDSADGFLLHAFYLNNNCSKEEAIDYYLKAYEGFKDEYKKNLTIDVFLDDIKTYKAQQFNHLFEKLFALPRKDFEKVFLEALVVISTNEIDSPYGDIVLGEEDFDKYLGKPNNEFKCEDYSIKTYEDKIFIYKNNKFFKYLDKEHYSLKCEKFVNEKSEIKATYNFYVDEELASIKFKEENSQFEELISPIFPITKYKEGCYVATCVYGSYDSPKVITLRNYRDNVLKKTILGRMFIKLYYFVSPTIVNMFKTNKRFHSFNKRILDKIIDRIEK